MATVIAVLLFILLLYVAYCYRTEDETNEALYEAIELPMLIQNGYEEEVQK